jgi:hypothetical protein
MNETLLVIGVMCVIVAVVGGGLKIAGNEIPVLASMRRQALLAFVGIAVLIGNYLISHEITVDKSATEELPSVSPGLSDTEFEEPSFTQTPGHLAEESGEQSRPSASQQTGGFEGGQFDPQKWRLSMIAQDAIYAQDDVLNLRFRKGGFQGEEYVELLSLPSTRPVREITFTMTARFSDGESDSTAGIIVDQGGRNHKFSVFADGNGGTVTDYWICDSPACDPAVYEDYREPHPSGTMGLDTPTNVRISWSGNRVEFHVDGAETLYGPRDVNALTHVRFFVSRDTGSGLQLEITNIIIAYLD